MDKNILLYFGDFEEKRTVVERVLNDMDIPYRILLDEDINETTGYLMDLAGFVKQPDATSTHNESDLMILNHISDEEIALMNQHMNALGVAMSRKAMLTEHNQHWKVCDLLKEINREHQYFQYVEKIQALLSSSQSLVIEEYTKASWKRYEKAFYEAYECITNQSSLEQATSAYHSLEEAKAGLTRVQ